jgi:hypothetical protein
MSKKNKGNEVQVYFGSFFPPITFHLAVQVATGLRDAGQGSAIPSGNITLHPGEYSVRIFAL